MNNNPTTRERANMIERIRKNLDFIFILSVLWGITVYFLIVSLSMNDGYLIYAQDDAYIHMAIAKNFSRYGVWGINRYGFSSSSSSLLYTLLLSFCFLLFGPNQIIPFILNLVFATLLMYVIYVILKKRFNLPSYAIIMGSIAIIIFAPIPRLIFTGMEHTLHILITISFVYFATKILSKEESKENNIQKEKKKFFSDEKLLLLQAPLVTMVRFEGIFLIVIVLALLILQKKFLYSIVLGGIGFLPVLIFGMISIYLGWFFFPNSIMVKANFPNFSSLENIFYAVGYSGFKQLMICPHLLFLTLGASLVIYYQVVKKKEIWKDITIMSIIFIFITFLQLQFAGTDIWSRYDAYLVVLGIFIVLIAIKPYIPVNFSIDLIKKHLIEIKKEFGVKILFREGAIILICLVILSPFIYRSAILVTTPESTNNTYEQQYQMGLFLNKYYKGEWVVVNDIGATNFLADVKCVDLLGLGNKEVAAAIRNHNYDNDTVYDLSKEKGCKIAIINYNFDYLGGIPSKWTLVGEWTLSHENVILASTTVYFYAIDEDETDTLIKNLQDFSKQLPDTIIESGNYTE